MEIENAKRPIELELLDPATWVHRFDGAPPDMIPLKVWRSRGFLVQAHVAKPPAVCRLSINRTALQGGRWVDGITWDDLQRLKREAGYGSHDAIEIYPADVDVVNVANIRHLWVMPPDSLPFAWRAKK